MAAPAFSRPSHAKQKTRAAEISEMDAKIALIGAYYRPMILKGWQAIMKKLLFIGTGGTIASELEDGALSPMLNAEQLLRHVPAVSKICDVDAVQLFTLDSTNITPAHWVRIADEIIAHYDRYDGFVIAHGTDTMAYTAAALSYLIQNSRKPIVITGAQKPIGFETTDSKQNLTDSFLCAASDLSGVLVVFGGQVLLGSRARKTRSKSFSAFSSPNYPPLATVQNGRIALYFNPTAGEERFYHALDPAVGLLKLTPGTDTALLRFMLERYHALVIESFGVGGLPDHDGAFQREVARAVENGKLVALTTQVQNEGTDLSVYNVGCGLTDLGVFEAFDMTPEACFTKLMWILPQTKRFDERRALFYTPVCHDILPPEILPLSR